MNTSNTFGSIKQHLKIHHYQKNKDLEENQDDIHTQYDIIENIKISPEIDRLIWSKFKSMILKTGKPFAMVANEDLKSVLHFLGTTQELSAKCEIIAQKVKSRIKYLLTKPLDFPHF